MREGISQINCWALQLQIDDRLPNLFCFSRCKLSCALDTIGSMICILEDIVVPEYRVLDELLVGNSSDHSTIQVHWVFQDSSLNLKVNIIQEQPFRAKIASHKHLKNIDQISVVQARNMHRKKTNELLKEYWVFYFLKLVVRFSFIIKELFIIKVKHRCEISCFCFVKHANEVLSGFLPSLWIFYEKSIKRDGHSHCMLEVEKMSSLLIVSDDFVSDRMIVPIMLVPRISPS